MSIALIGELAKSLKQGADVNAAMMKMKADATKASSKFDAKKASVAEDMKKKRKSEKVDEKMQMIAFTSLIINVIAKSLTRKPFSIESAINDLSASLQLLRANKAVLTQMASQAASEQAADAWMTKTDAAMTLSMNQLAAAASELAASCQSLEKSSFRALL